jgi:hypothetical protein
VDIASSIFRCVGIETPSDPSAWNKAILWANSRDNIVASKDTPIVVRNTTITKLGLESMLENECMMVRLCLTRSMF